MKQAKLLIIVLILALVCAACAKPSAQVPAPSAAAATPSPSPQAVEGTGPSGRQQDAPGDKQADPQADEQSAQGKDRRLYDPSIFVIEASGTWRQEIEAGYYADYECELYLHKVDSNDNRSSDGVFTGFFWMNMKLDTAEFIKDMLKDVPIEMQFDGGGEAICDNLGFSLRVRDDWEYNAYTIPLDGDKKQEAAAEVLMDKGSFVAVAKQTYISAKATGAQGEKLDYYDSKDGNIELNYIVHMEPDSRENGTERKVTIYLNDGQSMSTVLTGVMRRLPGYPDDVADYTQQSPYQQAINKHLE